MSDIEKCKSCDAPIRFLAHIKTGKLNPINATPDESGNIAITLDDEHYVIVSQSDTASLWNNRLYTSHFVTCPNAKQFRRK